MSQVRRTVVTVVIASFALSALLGIVALLGGGDLSELQLRVLLTTVIVGAEAVAVLCYLAVAGRPVAPVGVIGAMVSLVPFAIALLVTWSSDLDSDGLFQLFGVTLAVAVALAHACLILALRPGRRGELVRLATLAVIAVVTMMIAGAILTSSDLSGSYWRILGILAILDVLGTITVTALARFGDRDQLPAPHSPGQAAAGPPALLAPLVETRVIDAAAARDMTPSQLVSEALDRYLGSR